MDNLRDQIADMNDLIYYLNNYEYRMILNEIRIHYLIVKTI